MSSRTMRAPRLAPAAAIVVSLAMLLVLMARPADAQAVQSFTVDTQTDTLDAQLGDGVCADDAGACSLRAAIQEAGESSEATKITLAPGTYRFTLENVDGDEDASLTGDLDISSEVRISAFGATIDTDWLDRAFDVGADGVLVLSGVTIVNGYAPGGDDPIVGSGGAIRNAGVTTVQLATFVGNRAEGPAASGGAILNTGELIVRYSNFDGNWATRAGGAIEANGGLTNILASTFTANTTGPEPGNGGAFHLSGAGNVSITDSTFDQNTATAEGGGVWNSAAGTMVVTDSTFTANRADGAEATQGGGAVFNDGGSLTVTGSLLQSNSADGEAGSGGGLLNDQGTVTITNSRIVDNVASRAGGGVEANLGTTIIESTVLERNDAGAAPGNGGALHITGAGNATINSIEARDNVAGSEGGGLWNGSGTMTLTDSLIIGNVASGAEADQGGGGLFNAGGTLIVEGGSIEDNVADGAAGSGGGVLNDQGSVELSGTSISGNISNRAGGGIEANVGTTTIAGVLLVENTTGAAPGNGGGFHITGAGDATVTDSIVFNNTAGAEGGGLWNGSGTMTVSDTLVSFNTADGAEANQGGGGLFNAGGTLVVERGSVANNSATGAAGSGGGVLNDLGELTVTDTVIARNDSVRAGGGIEAVGGAEGSVGSSVLVDVDLVRNTTGDAPGNGGGFHLTGESTVDVSGGSVIGNVAAKEGGGLWNSSTGTMTATGVVIEDNRSPVGPDLFTQPGGLLTVTDG